MTMFSRTWAVPYVLARQELETTLREHGYSLAAEALLELFVTIHFISS